MNKTFIDLCYEIISHYAHFPEVADTLKRVFLMVQILSVLIQLQMVNFKKNDLKSFHTY